ncbi:MAG: Ig-like domain-containing protein [Actinobacteria bacterium]|nr:Ig-like domain-containing protein [Actinomycetota bacterium]
MTYTATVSPVPNGGTVDFTSDGTTIPGCGTVALSDGTAKCAVKYPLSYTNATYSIVAAYSGDSTYASSTSQTLDEKVEGSEPS